MSGFHGLNDAALRDRLWHAAAENRWNVTWGQALHRYTADCRADPDGTSPLRTAVESVITAVETYVRHVAREWQVLLDATAALGGVRTVAPDVRST